MSRSLAPVRSFSQGLLRCNNSYNNNEHKVLVVNGNEKEDVEGLFCLQNFAGCKYRTQLRWMKNVLGFLTILISSAILIWNERRAATVWKSYHEGLGSIRVLQSSLNVLPENDGKLVYVNGYLRMTEPLEDSRYGVSIYAVKLKRRVQMFQWVEERVSKANDLFEAIPYRYTKIWRDKLVNSSSFVIQESHENPKKLLAQSELRINSGVRLGSYLLGPELKDKFTNFIQFTSGERPANIKQIKMHMGLYYHASDIWNPKIGDLRVQFSFAGASDTFISIIAMQWGKELKPFVTESGIQILYLYEGRVNHLEIFKNEHSSFVNLSWVIRFIIWIVLIIGSILGSKSLALLNRRNAIVKNLMEVGRFKLSFIIASALSLCTIGGGWIQYKPVFGTLLIIFSCCLILYYSLVPTDNEYLSLNCCGRKIYSKDMTFTSRYKRNISTGLGNGYQIIKQRNQLKLKQ